MQFFFSIILQGIANKRVILCYRSVPHTYENINLRINIVKVNHTFAANFQVNGTYMKPSLPS